MFVKVSHAISFLIYRKAINTSEEMKAKKKMSQHKAGSSFKSLIGSDLWSWETATTSAKASLKLSTGISCITVYTNILNAFFPSWA